ncbi:MAG: shikimate kinase, partial [Bacteroidota bacterium]
MVCKAEGRELFHLDGSAFSFQGCLARSVMQNDNAHHPPEAHLRNRLIFLTGFMGSGKSTVGPILANTLGFELIDIDR